MEKILIEALNDLSISAINALVECVFPHGIEKKASVELEIALIEGDLRFAGLANYLTMIDRWYGHLRPGGLEGYLKQKDSDLRISHFKKDPFGFVVSKTISTRSEAQTLIVLWLLLRYLSKIGRPATELANESADDKAPAESAAVYRELQWGMRLGDIQKRIEKALSEDEKLSTLATEYRQNLSTLLTTIYHRDCYYLDSSIQFSHEAIHSITLNIQEPDSDKPRNTNRVDLERPITATLIQDGKEYQTQVIEYSANGSGLSFLIPTISEREKKNIQNKTRFISLLIGEKKYSAVIAHMDRRGDGLFLGIQFRFPIQNLAKILDI